jgi:hypothetical protein
MQKNMTESDTSEEELSISSDPRRDSAEMKTLTIRPWGTMALNDREQAAAK